MTTNYCTLQGKVYSLLMVSFAAFYESFQVVHNPPKHTSIQRIPFMHNRPVDILTFFDFYMASQCF